MPLHTKVVVLAEGTQEQGDRMVDMPAEFHYTLEHRVGARHGNADGLSREDVKTVAIITELAGIGLT